MNSMSLFGRLVVVALLAAPATGCVVRGHGRAHAHVSAPVAVIEVEEEPPPPRRIVVQARPGYIWIEGRHVRRGRNWVWVDGRWERERAGHRYEQGRWERRGKRHVWVEGRWHTRGPVVRDHRH